MFDQPDGSGRHDEYSVGELVELRNVRGTIATYWNGPWHVVRRHDGWIGDGGR